MLFRSPRSYDFYPRPPRGGRLKDDRLKERLILFLSPPSARRATPYLPPSSLMHCAISIPALREEGDNPDTATKVVLYEISIPALREEGDIRSTSCVIFSSVFLSPPSARRATRTGYSISQVHRHFYPRPPRGGRRTYPSCSPYSSKFLSPPSARRATKIPQFRVELLTFLSPPSARRATSQRAGPSRHLRDFYPRPPRGGRRRAQPMRAAPRKFLSPPSARRATVSSQSYHKNAQISIPALREEGDHGSVLIHECGHTNFYPRPPRGGRPQRRLDAQQDQLISIPALREEGDSSTLVLVAKQTYFYPRPPRGGRPGPTLFQRKIGRAHV